VEQDRVEHGAEHVVLALVESAVPDPDRPRAGVSREVVERRFGEVPPPVDPVHDLHRAVFGRIDVGDEFHELVGPQSRLSQWSACSVKVVSRIQV
jgi:hypothetical protein